jgi:hypothetical protein
MTDIEYRRIMAGRGRGFSQMDYFLPREELAQISATRIHPSNRNVQD